MKRKFVPPQHGAWAMLAVPYLAGLLVAGWSWVAVPLAGAWLAGYLLSYYVFQAIKTGRPGRWRHQIALYAALTLPLVAVVGWARPAVLWYAPAYAALWLINAWYARRRQERDLVNDIASVVQSCLMVFVVATVAGANPAAVAGVFIVCALYFTGTALFVKTMIRERNSVAYRRLSIGYHVAALALAVWLGPGTALLFAWLLLRAWLLAGRRLTPMHVGLIEIGNSVLLLIVVALTW
ncbi:MAG TPA: YwiC-like family protein [Jiangellaceae bacterium]